MGSGRAQLGENVEGRAWRGRGGAPGRNAQVLVSAGRKNQLRRILPARRFRQRHQSGARRAGAGFDRTDHHGKRAARQRGTERDELAAFKIAEHFRSPPVHAQKIACPRHVDVEKGAAHQEIGRFGGDVLGELGKALGGDHPGQPPLAAPAHEVGHGAQRKFARFVRNLARCGGGKELGFIDHHQHRIPELALGIEQPAHEGGSGAHLGFGIEPFERKDHGNAVLADTARNPGQFIFRAVRLDDHMPELFGQRHEISLGVDDALLHPFRALLEQAAQKVRLARTRIALHQKAGGQQLLEIERDCLAGPRCAHIDLDGHIPIKLQYF